MANKKQLVASIIAFLCDEQQNESLSNDSKESIEVAIQCLEAAYDVNPIDESLNVNKKLVDIFSDAVKQNISSKNEAKQVSTEAKQEAERLKNDGNNLMKNERFEEALQCYTKAIEIDSTNSVYYCNRAAAYSKLNNHPLALEDCKKAIGYDPQYSKAYGRMGLAYASLNDHHRARDCYKKAVELDPQNESYRNNLRIADDKMNEQSSQFGMPGMSGLPFDINSLINNPALLNMATQLMSDPSMQNLMGGIMSGSVNNSGGASGGTGIETLLQAGQQIAAQMQASNPDFVEQLRTAMSGGQQTTEDESGSQNCDDDQQNKNEDKKDK